MSPDAIAATNRGIIDCIKAQDPTFFTRFASEMQSGDRIRINNAIEEAGQRLLKLGEKSPRPDLNVIAAIAIAVQYSSYVIAFAIAAVAVAIAYDDLGPNKSTLHRDILVNLLAQRLGPAAQ